jgi:hypothetical protein
VAREKKNRRETNMNKKKLTLDDVLLKLQQDHRITAVTEADKITGGNGEMLDECHCKVGDTE